MCIQWTLCRHATIGTPMVIFAVWLFLTIGTLLVAYSLVMLDVFRVMLDVFLVMLHVFPVMLQVFHVMLQETHATLQETPVT